MAVTRTVEEIDREIAETKKALADVHGTETEVYARIVGYYRAVRNWNNGKRDEYNLRKMFVYTGTEYSEKENTNETELSSKEKISAVQQENAGHLNADHFEFFMRKTCPNCPPVKNYIESVSMEGFSIDVDTEEGLKQAAEKGVFSAPTVIFYDAKGNETGRAHNVEELDAILKNEAIPA